MTTTNPAYDESVRGWSWWSGLLALLVVPSLSCQRPPPRASAPQSPPTLRQVCERAGWHACRQLTDGVRRYLQGDYRGADLRFSAVAQVNDARALAGAAEAIRLIARSPDAAHVAESLDAAARRLILFAATPLPPPEEVVAPPTPRHRSAATIVRTARDVDYAANRTLAAPVDPTRLLTQTADVTPSPESVPCLAVGRPAHCTPLLEGPLLVTDVVASPGCTHTGAIGSLAADPRPPMPPALDTIAIDGSDVSGPNATSQTPATPAAPSNAVPELRWVITPPTTGLTGAAFFVSARERLVTVHFDAPPQAHEDDPGPRGAKAKKNPRANKARGHAEPAPPPLCQLTWAGFRPRALPSQSFPDSTRPPIENPYR